MGMPQTHRSQDGDQFHQHGVTFTHPSSDAGKTMGEERKKSQGTSQPSMPGFYFTMLSAKCPFLKHNYVLSVWAIRLSKYKAMDT